MKTESKTPSTDSLERATEGASIVNRYHEALHHARQLETELAASHSREVQLREALESLKTGIDNEKEHGLWAADQIQSLIHLALILPPPPVVPLELAERLADALEGVNNYGFQLNDKARTHVRKALTAWRAAQ